MLCAISGEAPEEPVVSKKSGIIYEKRLIEKYLQEHGVEPAGDELDLEDLLPIKSSRTVRPRPPTLTSIPALLSAFQSEWDSFALEQYNLREQLARTREELAVALYQHDAAVRVVARLTKERDEARQALSQVTVAPGGDAMAIDNEPLPQFLADHVDEFQKELSKGRKKRSAAKGWANADDISSFHEISLGKIDYHPSAIAIGEEYATIGTAEGEVSVYSLKAGKEERTISIGEAVTGAIWTDVKTIFSTEKGSVQVYESGDKCASFDEHAGAITGISIHPGTNILASVGVDKSFVFYSIDSKQKVLRMYTDFPLTTCAFHPDGHLFAAGTSAGDIKVFATKTGEQAAVFHLGAPVQAIAFSENGFWFAASGKDQPTVQVFDLRKEGDAAKAKELATGEALRLAWDYSGQYLATAGPSGVTIQQYAKSSKKWSELLRNSVPTVDLRWGPKAKTLVTASGDGSVRVMGT